MMVDLKIVFVSIMAYASAQAGPRPNGAFASAGAGAFGTGGGVITNQQVGGFPFFPIPSLPPLPFIPGFQPFWPFPQQNPVNLETYKPAAGQGFSGLSVETVNGQTKVTSNQNGVVESYEVPKPALAGGVNQQSSQPNPNILGVASSGFMSTSNLGGVVNTVGRQDILSNVNGQMRHESYVYGPDGVKQNEI